MARIVVGMTVDTEVVPVQVSGELASRGRFVRAGSLSGFVGAICCVGNAVALAAGIGALSFFGAWMQRYQPYFIAGSLMVMAGAAAWMVHKYDRRLARRMLLRHMGIMAAAYVVTLAVVTMVSGFFAR